MPLFQTEHGFCQKNRSDRGQIQDWYPYEKMVLVPIFLMVDVILQDALALCCIN